MGGAGNTGIVAVLLPYTVISFSDLFETIIKIVWKAEVLKKQLITSISFILGRVGRTFLYSKEQKKEGAFEFDVDSLAFDMGNEPVMVVEKSTKRIELTPQDVKDAHWFYDTPGITKENCVCIGFLLETFRSTVLTGRKQEKW